MSCRFGWHTETRNIAAAHELCYEDFENVVDKADQEELRDVLPARHARPQRKAPTVGHDDQG